MYATDTDSGRLQQIQEDCARDFQADGFADGYTGKLAQSSEFNYLQGYIQGVIRGTQEDKDRAERFAEYAEREAAIERGEPDWVTELLSDHDEPTLHFDEF